MLLHYHVTPNQSDLQDVPYLWRVFNPNLQMPGRHANPHPLHIQQALEGAREAQPASQLDIAQPAQVGDCDRPHHHRLYPGASLPQGLPNHPSYHLLELWAHLDCILVRRPFEL